MALAFQRKIWIGSSVMALRPEKRVTVLAFIAVRLPPKSWEDLWLSLAKDPAEDPNSRLICRSQKNQWEAYRRFGSEWLFLSSRYRSRRCRRARLLSFTGRART